jgi:exonuclease VII small subunit
MKGKYLQEARDQMQEAREETADGVVEEHGLLSLAALTEAFTELEARVRRLETGPRESMILLAETPPT